MKTVIAHLLGFIGFVMQAAAVFSLPIVWFTGISGWWLLLALPLGMAGMIPLGIGHMLLEKKKPALED